MVCGYGVSAVADPLAGAPDAAHCTFPVDGFDATFAEPLGRYFLHRHLLGRYGDADSLLFLLDIEFIKQIGNDGMRRHMAEFIFKRYLEPEGDAADIQLHMRGVNAIGVHGAAWRSVAAIVQSERVVPPGLFDEIRDQIAADLKYDAWPRFRASAEFRTYLRAKYVVVRSVTVDDFVLLGVIGQGAYGTVHACLRKITQQWLAAKCLSKRFVFGRRTLARVMDERAALIAIRSRFVCSLQYALQDDHTLIFVMELARGGDLRQHLLEVGQFPQDHVRFYAAEILLGLQHIHACGFLFRDLKLDNILLDGDGHVKISDLGLAVRIDADHPVTGYHGTPGYTAPEVVLGRPHTHLCDYFSYGVVVYMMLSGMAPFAGLGNDADAIVVRCAPVFEDDAFGTESVSLLRGLLEKQPEQRLGASSGIAEIKQHAFFHGVDWDAIELGLVRPPYQPKPQKALVEAERNGGRWRIGASRRPHGVEPAAFRRLHLSDEFRAALVGFEYVSDVGVQDELVRALEQWFIRCPQLSSHVDRLDVIPTRVSLLKRAC